MKAMHQSRSKIKISTCLSSRRHNCSLATSPWGYCLVMRHVRLLMRLLPITLHSLPFPRHPQRSAAALQAHFLRALWLASRPQSPKMVSPYAYTIHARARRARQHSCPFISSDWKSQPSFLGWLFPLCSVGLLSDPCYRCLDRLGSR